jgi:hypothetical protein
VEARFISWLWCCGSVSTENASDARFDRSVRWSFAVLVILFYICMNAGRIMTCLKAIFGDYDRNKMKPPAESW